MKILGSFAKKLKTLDQSVIPLLITHLQPDPGIYFLTGPEDLYLPLPEPLDHTS